MSNLSNIGFSINSKEELSALLENIFTQTETIKVKQGVYRLYKDKSGAEIWIQINQRGEFIGFNPHFAGKSKRNVGISSHIDSSFSELDGSFYAWADPESDNPESGAYPFVFDLPDFKTIGNIKYPSFHTIQLAAFAMELDLFDNDEQFDNSQESEIKFASQSFIPSGLFPSDENEDDTQQARGIFTGIIREFEKKTNSFTGETFYWFLVDTLGGEVDVVADENLITREPVQGGILSGSFWLSGRLLDLPVKKGFFQRLMGK